MRLPDSKLDEPTALVGEPAGVVSPAATDPRAIEDERPATWAYVPVVVILHVLATVVGFLLAVLVAVVRASAVHGGLPGWTVVRTDPHGRAITLLAFEVALAGLTLLVARSSAAPGRLGARLGVRRSRLPLREWPVAVLGAFGALVIGGAVAGAMQALGAMPPIGHARVALGQAFAAAHGVDAVLLVFAAAVLVPIVEELLFRGYLQRGLLEGWRPWVAWVATALVFAASHGDFTYGIVILPLALWVGFVALRADSIVPAIVIHAAVNAWGQLRVRGVVNAAWAPPAWAYAVVAAAPFVVALAVGRVWQATHVRPDTDRPPPDPDPAANR